MKKLLMCATLATSLLAPLTASAWPGDNRPSADNPPPTEPGWRTDRDGHYDRYDRFDRPNRNDRFGDRWLALSSFTPASRGRTSIRLSGHERHIDRLRLEAVRGTTQFRQIILEYANGDHERVPLDLALAPGQEHVVSIPGDRRVTRVTVMTEPRSGGAYSLYAD